MKTYLSPTIFVMEIQEGQTIAASPVHAPTVTTETDEWGESSGYRNNLWGRDSEE